MSFVFHIFDALLGVLCVYCIDITAKKSDQVVDTKSQWNVHVGNVLKDFTYCKTRKLESSF